MIYKLRFTNVWGERYWLANLGGFWGPGDTRRLIERTSSRAEQGREFASAELARETLTISGNSATKPDKHGVVVGWQVIDADGKPVE